MPGARTLTPSRSTPGAVCRWLRTPAPAERLAMVRILVATYAVVWMAGALGGPAWPGRRRRRPVAARRRARPAGRPTGAGRRVRRPRGQLRDGRGLRRRRQGPPDRAPCSPPASSWWPPTAARGDRSSTPTTSSPFTSSSWRWFPSAAAWAWDTRRAAARSRPARALRLALAPHGHPHGGHVRAGRTGQAAHQRARLGHRHGAAGPDRTGQPAEGALRGDLVTGGGAVASALVAVPADGRLRPARRAGRARSRSSAGAGATRGWDRRGSSTSASSC